MRVNQAGAVMVLVGAIAVFGVVLSAGEILSVSATPNSVSIVQGGTGSFSVSIDSVSGRVGARNPPDVAYCAEWTIHADATVTCDQIQAIALDRSRNYTQAPVTAADGYSRSVAVNVDSAAPCNVTYQLDETFSVPAGSGTNFGSDVLEVTRPVAVTVTCPVSTPVFAGCSHGYWKNHTSVWPAPYALDTKLGEVFTLPAYASVLANKSFQEALVFGGGNTTLEKAQVLLRNAVAALLNSVHSSITYEWSSSDVLELVNAALATGNKDAMLTLEAQLDAANQGSPFCGDDQ